jgi:hypothetical protein
VSASPLADDLAAVLAATPLGLPCDELAKRFHRRRADVLALLRGDPRFEQHDRARGSRWQLSRRRGRDWDGWGRNDLPWLELDPSGAPLIGREAEGG